MVDGDELILLLGLLPGAGLYNRLGLLHKNVLFVAIAVKNPDVQHRDLVHFFYRKHVRSVVAHQVIVVGEAL